MNVAASTHAHAPKVPLAHLHRQKAPLAPAAKDADGDHDGGAHTVPPAPQAPAAAANKVDFYA
jgi:hypothetical protein